MSGQEREMGSAGVTAPVAEAAAEAEGNRRWREENRAVLETYAEEVAREGLALESFRSF